MKLRYYPDRILARKCRPIEEVNDDVVRRARQMLDFMYESEGIGLAGPQIGWSKQIVTVDAEGEGKAPCVFVNPRIAHRSGHGEEEEGCLSLPGLRVVVPRAEKVVVVAFTLKGERVEIEAADLAGRVWQHEIDHLNGVLIIDKLQPTTLMTVRSRLKELEQEAASERQRQ